MSHPNYPDRVQIDHWCTRVCAEARETEFIAERLDDSPFGPTVGLRHHRQQCFIRFSGPSFHPFYALWQPTATAAPAPLLIHVPGYGAEMSAHPELVARGYNVLHVCPQGYHTPAGPDQDLAGYSGNWPVLPNTVTHGIDRGYGAWLRDVLIALDWARKRSDVNATRLGFFGTSQGGGGSLLLASIMREDGCRAVAADVPFLTNFPLVYQRPSTEWGAYGIAFSHLDRIDSSNAGALERAWYNLGFCDTISHAPRLTMPTLLTSGAEDGATPPFSIASLFEQLPGTRSYTEIEGQGHGYTPLFLHLGGSWFDYYV